MPDAFGAAGTRPQPTAALYGGFYGIPVAKAYRFIITAYIQDIMSGKGADYGNYISVGNPANFTSTSTPEYLPTLVSPGRAVIGGANSQYRMKLNLTYSKIN